MTDTNEVKVRERLETISYDAVYGEIANSVADQVLEVALDVLVPEVLAMIERAVLLVCRQLPTQEWNDELLAAAIQAAVEE